MNNNYTLLKEKLTNSYSKIIPNVNNFSELQKKLNTLISKFILPTDESEITNILKEKIVNQYEEKKDDIVFATLVEKNDNKYIVSMIIFDSDYIYSNLLKKSFTILEKANTYFEELKTQIKNNDINSLSNYIIKNM